MILCRTDFMRLRTIGDPVPIGVPDQGPTRRDVGQFRRCQINIPRRQSKRAAKPPIHITNRSGDKIKIAFNRIAARDRHGVIGT